MVARPRKPAHRVRHGTVSGYYWHYKLSKVDASHEICDDCKQAWNNDQRFRRLGGNVATLKDLRLFLESAVDVDRILTWDQEDVETILKAIRLVSDDREWKTLVRRTNRKRLNREYRKRMKEKQNDESDTHD